MYRFSYKTFAYMCILKCQPKYFPVILFCLFYETGCLCVSLAVLELVLQTKLTSNPEICLSLLSRVLGRLPLPPSLPYCFYDQFSSQRNPYKPKSCCCSYGSLISLGEGLKKSFRIYQYLTPTFCLWVQLLYHFPATFSSISPLQMLHLWCPSHIHIHSLTKHS